MSDHRYVDAARRAFQTAATRRAGLTAALGALLGRAAMPGAAATNRDAAKHDTDSGGKRRRGSRPGPEGPCGDGSREDNACTRDKQCCTGLCNMEVARKNLDGKGRCRCQKRGKPCASDSNCCGEITCNGGICSRPCNADTCPNGCCDGTTCVTTPTSFACGPALGICVACGSLAPVCAAGVCAAGTWAYSAQFGEEGAADDNLDGPYGVAVSPDTLTAWVADVLNNRIVIWTRPNAASTAWSFRARFGAQGTGDNNLGSPHGIAVSRDGLTVWVTDFDNNRIVIWTRPNAASTTWSFRARFGSTGAGDSNFASPSGIFVSPDTLTAWVADKDNNRITIWTRPNAASTTWTFRAKFGTLGAGDDNLDRPRAVFVSEDSLTAWVADFGNDRVVIWTRPDAASTAWSFHAKFGTHGDGDSNFDHPHDIAVSRDTLTAWVIDFNNSRVVIWTRPDAASTAWAYHAKFGKQGSGDLDFDFPSGLAVSEDTLTTWVADRGNNRISIWTQR